MKKVLFIELNSSWSHTMLSLYYMRALLPGEAEIVGYTLKDDPRKVCAELLARDEDVLCFAVYIWNSGYLAELMSLMISGGFAGTLVLGGPEAPALYARLGNTERCHVVCGPGEGAFRELAERDFDAPYGLISRENIPLKDLPFPYRGEDLSRLSGKLVYYETSRGCPFGCVYCLSSSDGRNERRFDLRRIEDEQRLLTELDALVALKPRTLKFVDRSFNTDKALAHRIWRYFLEQKDACVSHYEIYPDLLTDTDIDLLRDAPAGKIRFEVGIQTTNPVSMQQSRRISDWDKAKRMLQRLRRETEVIVHADLLIGLPGDDRGSVLNSLDELMQTLPHELQLGLLKILPDTPMQEIAKSRGYRHEPEPPYAVISSDKLNEEEVRNLTGLAQTLNLYYNKGEFYPEWQELLTREPAHAVLDRLYRRHREEGIALHSMEKHTRREMFYEIALGTELEK